MKINGRTVESAIIREGGEAAGDASARPNFANIRGRANPPGLGERGNPPIP